MWKKFFAVTLVVFGLASAANAGTDIIRDYSGDQFNNYAPPPPRPIYYAPPPPVNVLIFPAYGYYGPRFTAFGAHRYYARRAYWRAHDHWR